MSRLVKRVPVDFEHEGTWPGYTRNCGDDECGGCDLCARVDPPTGEGWQLWEDVSEGSPVSPVFVERASLVAWIVENEGGVSPTAADAFVTYGWAPSGIASPVFGFMTGLQLAAGEAVAIEWLYVLVGDHTTLEAGTRVQRRDCDVRGTVIHRAPPPNGEYYRVEWERGLPSLLADEPDLDPALPMTTWTRDDGFTVLRNDAP